MRKTIYALLAVTIIGAGYTAFWKHRHDQAQAYFDEQTILIQPRLAIAREQFQKAKDCVQSEHHCKYVRRDVELLLNYYLNKTTPVKQYIAKYEQTCPVCIPPLPPKQ